SQCLGPRPTELSFSLEQSRHRSQPDLYLWATMAGGFSGTSHVGCPSSGQSGFCEITHREWSKHAPFSHHLQTRGIVQ
ncbi:hypothetical protein J0S82_015805, partial [Galemys pyrenaicus]